MTEKMDLTQMAIILCFWLLSAAAYEIKPAIELYNVTVAGQTAWIPCILPLNFGSPSLILWYKNSSSKPFFIFDSRSGVSRTAVDTSVDNLSLANRSSFTVDSKPLQDLNNLGYLKIWNVVLEDAGNYTCRVNFDTAQTVRSLLHLEVYEGPKGVLIEDNQQREVKGQTSFYEEEETSFSLVCRVLGGHPPPSASWFAGHRLLSTGTGEASFAIPVLRREHHGREFACLANNSEFTPPLRETVELQMYLKPLDVIIKGLSSPVLSEKATIIECQTTGSNPAAKISWEPADKLQDLGQEISPDANMTVAKALLTPTADDDQLRVSCTATNPVNSHYSLMSSRTLRVYYSPKVKIRPGRGLDTDALKEGADVYFECLVEANPPQGPVSWLHQGSEVERGKGVFMQNNNLVLQRVQRGAKGQYQCRASNDIGTTTSPPINLTVMYPPECRNSVNSTVYLSSSRPIGLVCRVNAFPQEVKFSWFLNTTEGLQSVQPENFTFSGVAQSTFFYQPSLSEDFWAGRSLDLQDAGEVHGTVLCSAENAAGTQRTPCAFFLIPAGPPESLKSCVLHAQNASSLRVSCEPGHDGGLPQWFLVKVTDIEASRSVFNRTSPTPNFILDGLSSGRDFLVSVFAINERGASEPYRLEGFALKVAENKISDPQSRKDGHLVEIVAGSAVAILVCVVMSILVVVRRCRRRDHGQEYDTNQVISSDNELLERKDSRNAEIRKSSKQLELDNYIFKNSDTNLVPQHEGISLTMSTAGSPLQSSSLGILTRAPSYTLLNSQDGRLSALRNPAPVKALSPLGTIPQLESHQSRNCTLKVSLSRRSSESFV